MYIYVFGNLLFSERKNDVFISLCLQEIGTHPGRNKKKEIMPLVDVGVWANCAAPITDSPIAPSSRPSFPIGSTAG